MSFSTMQQMFVIDMILNHYQQAGYGLIQSEFGQTWKQMLALLF